MNDESQNLYARIRAMVKRIPRGAVATYGDISEFVTGTPSNARLVGYAMAGLTGEALEEVPWWRVINARGAISPRVGEGEFRQRELLEEEGIVFEPDGHVSLARYAWDGPGA